jgi:hypothetical protein
VPWILTCVNVSSASHAGIDGAGAAGVFSLAAVSPFAAGTQPVVVAGYRKVATPSSFDPPPVVAPEEGLTREPVKQFQRGGPGRLL